MARAVRARTRARRSTGPKWSEWLTQQYGGPGQFCDQGQAAYDWCVAQEEKGRTPQEMWKLAPQEMRDQFRDTLDNIDDVIDRLEELSDNADDYDEILSASFVAKVRKPIDAEVQRLKQFTKRNAPTLRRISGEIVVRWA